MAVETTQCGLQDLIPLGEMSPNLRGIYLAVRLSTAQAVAHQRSMEELQAARELSNEERVALATRHAEYTIETAAGVLRILGDGQADSRLRAVEYTIERLENYPFLTLPKFHTGGVVSPGHSPAGSVGKLRSGKTVQSKHLSEEAILARLRERPGVYHTHWNSPYMQDDGPTPRVWDRTHPDAPHKVLLSKLTSMVKRGLIKGCGCGCRGDWHVEVN